MPIYLKEYAILVPHIILATTLFSLLLRKRIFLEWGFLWLAVWSIAYLLRGIYWMTIFMFFFGVSISQKTRAEKIAYYFVLLPTLPLFVSVVMPGVIPGIKVWMKLNVPTLLSMFVLFPLAMRVFFFGGAKDALGAFKTDKYVLFYFILLVALSYRSATLTAGLREMLINFLEVFLPYYAISRALKKKEDFELVFYAVVFSGMIVATVGIMEELLRWPMFLGLIDAMHLEERPISPFTVRGGLLKIGSTFASGTPCGYFLTAVIAISYFLKNFVKVNKKLLYLISGLCLLAIFFTAARGAWLGFLVMALIVAVYQKGKKVKLILGFLLTAYIALPFLNYTSAGQAITNKIEQVVPTSKEHSEYGTIDYRERLVTAVFTTMSLHPWFGSLDFLETEEMQAMKQGEGIIDVVNTYFQIGLAYGWVGLVLFTMIFVNTALKLFFLANSQRLRRKNEYFSQMTAVFLSIVVMTVVLIGTVSSVSLLPHYFWAFTAIAAATVRVVTNIKRELIA